MLIINFILFLINFFSIHPVSTLTASLSKKDKIQIEEKPQNAILTSQKVVKIGEVELWTEALGNPKNPPILLISGAGSHAHFWSDPFCKKFVDKGYFVIRYDNRDVGLSSAVNFEKFPYDLNDLAKDAAAILDNYGLKKAHLIGHSMGGYIAQLFAVNYPDRLLSVSVIGSGPAGGTTELDTPPTEAEKKLFDEALQRMFGNRPSKNFEESLDGFLTLWKFLHGKVDLDLQLAIAYAKDMYIRSKHPIGARRGVHFSVMQKMADTLNQRREIFSKIHSPFLIIQGGEDPLILPRRGGVALSKVLPHSKLELIPEMGHMFFNPSLEDKIASLIFQFHSSH
ncbi:MAG: alpha/beta fold hydrolase [Chlamydiae bacterium]|nr:alpha/beta fold hydrolase [Chlamydiota bacterium]